MHGGTVTANSEGLGHGSEVVVQLPANKQAREGPETANFPEPSKGAIQKLRILIVDDNRDSARTLGMLLSFMGNDVQTAYDGLQALQVAASFIPHVILLDIGLPKLNGYEVCRRIREQSWSQGVVIVACTGWSQEEDIRKAENAGFDRHMVKPVDSNALGRILATLNHTQTSPDDRGE